ncbi:hypothetical protein A2U01_0093246, partial [Trifolium medium]|nr:hypothetical protein [Trifolium medium]
MAEACGKSCLAT